MNTPFTWTGKKEHDITGLTAKVSDTTGKTHFSQIYELSKIAIPNNRVRRSAGKTNTWRLANCWICILILKFCRWKIYVNELELLRVVWSIEYFHFGKQLCAITDSIFSLSRQQAYRLNKSYSSRLNRWIDCLLPLNVPIYYLPGSRMGLIDYRNPIKN